MANIDMLQMRADIKSDEGVVLHAYQDTLGYWTIGSGILIDQRRGGGISEHENDFLVDTRLQRLLGDMDNKMPWLLLKSDGVQRALTNVAWQLGLAGLLEFKDMLSKVQSGDYSGAASALLDSLYAKQTPERAQRIASLLKNG